MNYAIIIPRLGYLGFQFDVVCNYVRVAMAKSLVKMHKIVMLYDDNNSRLMSLDSLLKIEYILGQYQLIFQLYSKTLRSSFIFIERKYFL